MKNIVTVNTELPTIKDYVEYRSGTSLMDYDIVLFDPTLPYETRIDFSGGGSCISIEGTTRLKQSMGHWSREFSGALRAGKTIFILLNEYDEDSGASGYTTVKGSRTYSTYQINNYDVLPTSIGLRNAKGKHLKIADTRFKGLYDAIKDIAEYQVVITSAVTKKIFTSKDGSSVVSAIVKLQDLPGNIVFLPFFDIEQMNKYDEKKDKDVWTTEAIRTSKIIVSQLVEIDRVLRSDTEETPKPEWLESIELPRMAADIEKSIQKYESDIAALMEEKNKEVESRNELLKYSALLYENGKQLELAIERCLQLIGYSVQNFREGDLEIDHIITSPEGFRMIGESEGKDNTAIDISKFRQLETNINEDFARDVVSEPAKGILFGNGFRLVEPSKRDVQFTEKCLTNAKRLGTALVRTMDLYKVALHILDNPEDDKFKTVCRDVIENTAGKVVEFPKPTAKSENPD